MNICRKSTSPPLVSVVIPAYNTELFIGGTLNSVLSQTYRNIEILVVDDGSQDNTADIVKQMSAKDNRIILLHQANSGTAAARNLAIENARGEYIAPIDADDIWLPINLEKQVACMSDSGPSVGVVYAWSVDIDENGSPTGEFRACKIEGEVYATLLCHNFIGNASSSLIRRLCLDKVGHYSRNFMRQGAQGCEDWELYLRISKYYQFRVVPEFLIGYRRSANSMSSDCDAMEKSHQLMLHILQQEHTDTLPVFSRLSTVNLYLYFAHQCSLFGSKQKIRYWLRKSFQTDFIVTCSNFRLYAIFVTNCFSCITKAINLLHHRSKQYNNLIHTSSSGYLNKPNLNHNFYKKRSSIFFKVMIGNVFHRMTTILYKHWKWQKNDAD